MRFNSIVWGVFWSIAWRGLIVAACLFLLAILFRRYQSVKALLLVLTFLVFLAMMFVILLGAIWG